MVISFYSELNNGEVNVADTGNSNIKFEPILGRTDGVPSSSTTTFNDTNNPSEALLGYAAGIVATGVDEFVISDMDNHHLRSIYKDGDVFKTEIIAGPDFSMRQTLVAQNKPFNGFAGDNGPASKALFNILYGITASSTKTHLYVADSENKRIRLLNKVNGSYVVSTVVGGGAKSSGANISGTDLALNTPIAVSMGDDNTLFILDYGTQKIWRAAKNGDRFILNLFVGGSASGFALGKSASSSRFGSMVEMKALGTNELLIVDTTNGILRRIFSDSTTYKDSIVAGVVGGCSDSCSTAALGDGGPATSAKFSVLSAVTTDSTGGIYVADMGTSSVRKINPKTGIINTIFGGDVNNDCGSGYIDRKVNAKSLGTSFNESINAICALNPIAITVSDNCTTDPTNGFVDTLISQFATINSNIVRITKPCAYN